VTLIRLEPNPDRLLYCDVCCESEVHDIRDVPGELKPIYRDEEEGFNVCQNCLDAGKYAEMLNDE
jgi:hypothetical protein